MKQPRMTPELRKRIAENEAQGFKFKGFNREPDGRFCAIYEKEVDRFSAKLDAMDNRVCGADLGQWCD